MNISMLLVEPYEMKINPLAAKQKTTYLILWKSHFKKYLDFNQDLESLSMPHIKL